MKQRPDQLGAQLARELKPVYLIHGEEPLQALEAADAVRAAARAQGYDEREVLSVETGFDWSSLAAAAGSLSLFGSRRLLELRLGNSKPGDAGGRALRAYCARPPAETVLLIEAGKLDAQQLRSAWYTALDGLGVSVQCYPLEARQLPEWLERRARARGLQLTPEALALLAARVEGNLLAGAQELDKLWLLHGATPIDAECLLDAVGDSARYSIYDFTDAALEGDAARVLRIAAVLQAEGEATVLVLWALARELRLLAQAATDIGRGAPVDAALGRLKVWEKRKPLLRRALGRHDTVKLRRLLAQAARIDRCIKGSEAGSVWDDLLELALRLAGCDLGLPRVV